MTKLSYERNGQEYAVQVESLPPQAIAYLLQYGFAQSLQDSIAGLAKATTEDWNARRTAAEAGGLTFDERLEDTVFSAINGQLLKRLDAIVAGTIGTRTASAPRDPYAAECRKIAREMLTGALRAKGIAMPKDKAKVEELLANIQEKYSARINAEARTRLEAKSSIVIDADDLGI